MPSDKTTGTLTVIYRSNGRPIDPIEIEHAYHRDYNKLQESIGMNWSGSFNVVTATGEEVAVRFSLVTAVRFRPDARPVQDQASS